MINEMGYTTKDIALIYEPKRVSLSALPNFVQFQSKPGAKTYLEANITVDLTPAEVQAPNSVLISIIEPSGTVHSFRGTVNAEEVGAGVFYVDSDKATTAENIRQAMLSDNWVRANFELRIPSVWTGDTVTNGTVINVKSKGTGADYNINIVAPNPAAYTVTWIHPESINGDSISGEAATVEISLDVYTDAPIFLGADDKPLTSELLGTYALTLSKTYTGDVLWFDVNAPFAKATGLNLPSTGWFDTGTMRVIRFVARVAGVNNFTFYQSNALYVLRGYSALSDAIDLENYVYTNENIKLLTNKPRTIYVKGQTEYLNFILSAAADVLELYVLYRAYDTRGEFIGEHIGGNVNKSALSMVNTYTLQIDDVLDLYPSAGLIRVALGRDGVTISNDLEYTVRPTSLHTLRQFSFLNKLGGWDSFNFDAGVSEDVKVSFDTFTRTVTPEHTKGEGVESVYTSQLENVLTVTGAPVTDDVAEWLKELAASTVVLDSDGNYIIKTEFSMSISDGATNMQVPTMKYKISETYTNE